MSKSADPLVKVQTPNLWTAKGRLDQNTVRLVDAVQTVKAATGTATDAKAIDQKQEKQNVQTITALQKAVAKLSNKDVWVHRIFGGLAVICFGLAGYFAFRGITVDPKNFGWALFCAVAGGGAAAVDLFYETIALAFIIAAGVAVVGGIVFITVKEWKKIRSLPPKGAVAVVSAAPGSTAVATVEDQHATVDVTPPPATVITTPPDPASPTP